MAGWRRSELKAGVYDEIVSARLDRQLAALGAPFEVYRSALTVTSPSFTDPSRAARSTRRATWTCSSLALSASRSSRLRSGKSRNISAERST